MFNCYSNRKNDCQIVRKNPLNSLFTATIQTNFFKIRFIKIRCPHSLFSDQLMGEKTIYLSQSTIDFTIGIAIDALIATIKHTIIVLLSIPKKKSVRNLWQHYSPKAFLQNSLNHRSNANLKKQKQNSFICFISKCLLRNKQIAKENAF